MTKSPLGCLSCVLPILGLLALVMLGAWSISPARSAEIARKATQPGKPKPNSIPTAGTKLGALGDITFTNLAGKRYDAARIGTQKAAVFLFVSSQCPISNVYAPRFAALAAEGAKRNFAVFAVYSNAQESQSEIAAHAKQRGFRFPIVRDVGARLADRLGATATPQAVVVDSQGIVRYRGRIDDNAVATKATTHDLVDAVEAVLNGQPVARPVLPAFGCAIRRPKPVVSVAPGIPTYALEVSRILQNKCEGCHRLGEVAPFSLGSYAQASAWASDIKRYTQSGAMPPWKPSDAGSVAFQDQEAHRLTDGERTILAKWADAGAPLGNVKALPAPRKFASGWQLGTPDMVVTPSQDFHLGADGDDVYRNFVVKTNFSEDRYIRAVEARPGNAAVVHHVVNYIDAKGESDALEGKEHDGEPGYSSFGGPGFNSATILSGWAPGNNPTLMPDGVGLLVPKGARIVIQVHYHKDGKPETDRTKLGLYFSQTTVDKSLVNFFLVNWAFVIAPGNPHYVANASKTLREDVHIVSVLPHMHWLGKQIKVWATLPDGTEKPIVAINDWDFNWQGTYYLKEPMALPKGAKLHVQSVFDNSANNLRNPDRNHLKTVIFGEQTSDEMCVAFIGMTRDAEHLAYTPSPVAKSGAKSVADSISR